MRQLLVLSPHFPPSDVVDMHRVRMNVGHYAENGWRPSVLSVDARDAARLTDPNLTETVSPEIDVTRARAIPKRFTDVLGVSAIGLRGYDGLRRAGDRLLSGRRFDLLFISTTAFPVMALGPYWRKKHGLPYVLDFQDPWYTAPPSSQPFRRSGLKHEAMRQLHRALERRALQSVDGIISVSPDYVTALRDAFPHLADTPAEVIPFGFSAADLDVAERLGRAVPAPHGEDRLLCVSAGRAGADMTGALQALFRIARRAREIGAEGLGRMAFLFLGTGYQTSGNPEIVAPIAVERGMRDDVVELPDRAPLLDSLQTLQRSDVLLVLGSDDLAYQPSKLYQYLHIPKPILCVAPRNGRLAAAVDGLDSVVLAPSDVPLDDDAVRELAARIDALTRRADLLTGERRIRAEGHEARRLAQKECAVFDRVAERAAA